VPQVRFLPGGTQFKIGYQVVIPGILFHFAQDGKHVKIECISYNKVRKFHWNIKAKGAI
jgi:hypothetical protein